MLTVALREVDDPENLAERWRALEDRADASFFQSWTWLGCRVRDRFDQPVLLEARRGERDVALALLNRVRRFGRPETLFLGETGRPAHDAVFVEHNGVLIDASEPADTLDRCLHALLALPTAPGRRRRWRRLVLGGVDARHRAALDRIGAVVLAEQSRTAPALDLCALGSVGDLGWTSANTRSQIRRSTRLYAESGSLSVTRAATADAALAAFETLVSLHQAAWNARGKRGAFAAPEMLVFHRSLIRDGLQRDETDLLTVTAGGEIIGILYNFRRAGRVFCYQSGFSYRPDDGHRRPGLTSHQLAIAHYRLGREVRAYDFLAGEDRYKTSFSNTMAELFWCRAAPTADRTARLGRVLRNPLRAAQNHGLANRSGPGAD